MASFNSLSDAKVYVLNQLNKKLQAIQGNYNSLLSNIQSVDDPTFSKSHGTQFAYNQIQDLNYAIDKVDTVFSGLETSLKGYTSTFKGSNFKGGNVGSAKSSGSSSGKSDAQKQAEDDAKEQAKLAQEAEEARIKAEEDANKRILDLRNKLADAIKQQYEEMRDAEIKALDDEIQALNDQLDALENGYSNEGEKLAKLQEQLALWKNDDSKFSEQKQKELQEEINKQLLRVQIESKEKEKDTVSEKYDKMLEEQSLYNSANQLLVEKNFTEIQTLLEKYGGYIQDTMTSVSDYVKGIIDQLKQDQSTRGGSIGSTPKPTVTSSTPKSSSGGGTGSSSGTSSGTVTKGSRVKITDMSAPIYYTSTVSSNSGSWRGSGVGNDTLYVTNMANGRVALGRNTNVNSSVGWIDLKYAKRFLEGGVTPSNIDGGALGILHSSERVLTAQQTKAFEKLVDMLPLLNMSNMKFSNIDLFKGLLEKETPILNYKSEFNINNNGTEIDGRKMDTNIEKALKITLRRGGVLK